MTIFTSDWFIPKIPAWIEHVVPRLRNIPSARWLEVGTYEGRSALWTLDNVLSPTSTITCIDLFSSKESYIDLWGTPGYEDRFDQNTAGRSNVIKLQGHSRDLLPPLVNEGQTFHGAYVDADHKEKVLADDLDLVWKLLLPNAVLVCDDYGYVDEPGARIAIDNFLAKVGNQASVLYIGFQIIILKQDRN